MSSEIVNGCDLRYLPLVAEEAAEVIQAIMKIQRFGPLSKHPDKPAGHTNLIKLHFEIGDLYEVISMLQPNLADVYTGRVTKRLRLKEYGPQNDYS